MTHTSGIVTLEAIINEEGNVTKLTVLSGHPLLVEAAREAVMRWKYSPTILNGEAVPVCAMVKITFRIR
jgi:protein TonB